MNVIYQNKYRFLFYLGVILASCDACDATTMTKEFSEAVFKRLKTVDIKALKNPALTNKKKRMLRDHLKLLPVVPYDLLPIVLKNVSLIQDNLVTFENEQDKKVSYVTAYYALSDIALHDTYLGTAQNSSTAYETVWPQDALNSLELALITYVRSPMFQGIKLPTKDRKVLGEYASYISTTSPLEAQLELFKEKNKKVLRQALDKIKMLDLSPQASLEPSDDSLDRSTTFTIKQEDSLQDDQDSSMPVILIGGGGCVLGVMMLDSYLNGGGIYGYDKASLLCSISSQCEEEEDDDDY